MSKNMGAKVIEALGGLGIAEQWVSRDAGSVSITVCGYSDDEMDAKVQRITDAMPDGVDVSLGDVDTVSGSGGLGLSGTLTFGW